MTGIWRFINICQKVCSIFFFFLLFSVVANAAVNGVFNVKDFGAVADGKKDDAKVMRMHVYIYMPPKN